MMTAKISRLARLLPVSLALAAVGMLQMPACAGQTALYTYSDLKNDLNELVKEYASCTELLHLGETFDEREILCLRIGEPAADHSILVTGSIHAREYLTTELVMSETRSFLESLRAQSDYKGIPYSELLSDCSIYVIPMVNPDGVALSQLGTAGLQTEKAKTTVYRIYEMDHAVEIDPYLMRWKSNAEGVDLNRNFDALWNEYDDSIGHPSSDHYKGIAPGCCPESRALIELTEKIRFDRTVSYHTQGEVIYWYFGQTGGLYDTSKAFAERISKTTGYVLDPDYSKLDPAGYKDWALMKMKIPSLTIEVGTDSSPVDPAQFDRIQQQNKNVLEETILSIRDRG